MPPWYTLTSAACSRMWIPYRNLSGVDIWSSLKFLHESFSHLCCPPTAFSCAVLFFPLKLSLQ